MNITIEMNTRNINDMKIETTKSQSQVIFLMGPTASGKTSLAIKLCKILPVELISVDSGLTYRGMNIGTAKPNESELRIAPHRLLDILDPMQTYSAENFRRDALIQIKEIIAARRIPLLVGGTMFYFKALLKGLSPLPSADLKIREKIKQQLKQLGKKALHKKLEAIDPIAAKRIHPNDLQRLSRALEVFFVSGITLTELMKTSGEVFPYRLHQFAIAPVSRELLYQRIERRFYQMLSSGFEEEVRELFSHRNLHKDMPSIRCIGYRQMWSYLVGEISYNEMIHQCIRETKKLAKRQMTWLHHWENIHWLDSEKAQDALNKISLVVGNNKS